MQDLQQLDAAIDRRADALTQYKTVEPLPFVVQQVQSEEDLAKVLHTRVSAYGRHLPELSAKLRDVDAIDQAPSTIIMLAKSKLDGSPLGTMRIEFNDRGPLAIEGSIELRSQLQGKLLAEATRLCVVGDRIGSLAKTVMFKAYFLICEQLGVDYMVVGGRNPVHREYERLLFQPESEDFIPMKHGANIPHKVYSLEIASTRQRWRAANHKLCTFMFDTHHPDILFAPDVCIGPFARFAATGSQLPTLTRSIESAYTPLVAAEAAAFPA